jgi:DNA-binding beta-propeller fold protein YncE
MKKVIFIGLGVFLLCASAEAFQLSSFEKPESAVRDPETDAVFVSNINGDLFAKDGNGYISRISASGAAVIQKFIGGKPESALLDAPKGLCIWAEDLIVADIDKIKIFHKKSGVPLRIMDLSMLGAVFLNDVVVDSAGMLYVSDTIANKIFSVDLKTDTNTSARVLYEGAQLGGPNGLTINPRSHNLLIVTWNTGAILELDRGGRLHILKRGLKNLDGIDFDDQWNLYVSSFSEGEIYRIPLLGRGTLSVFADELRTPADISFDRRKRELLVPLTESGSLESIPQSGRNTGSDR